ERAGGSKYPDIERGRAIRPELVLCNSEENRPEDVERLRADGIPVWVMEAPATVPAALGSLRRLLTQAFELSEPEWLCRAEELWAPIAPVERTVVEIGRASWRGSAERAGAA